MKPRRHMTGLAIFAAFALQACMVVVPVPLPTSGQAQVQRAAPVRTPVAVRVSTANVGTPPQSAFCPLPADAKAHRAAILQLVNQQRRAHGLPSLKANNRLTKSAQHHACDNAARGGYSHVSSDGADLKVRLLRAGYKPYTAVENTGWGFTGDSTRMMNYWMNSPKHRANILNPRVSQFGLGVALHSGGRAAWVLNLGKSL